MAAYAHRMFSKETHHNVKTRSVSYLVFCAQSINRDYIRADKNSERIDDTYSKDQ